MKFLAVGSILILSTILFESESQFSFNGGSNFQFNNRLTSNFGQVNEQNFGTGSTMDQLGSNSAGQSQGFGSGMNVFGSNSGVNFPSNINGGGFGSNTEFTFPTNNQNTGFQGIFPTTNPSNINSFNSSPISQGFGSNGSSFQPVNTKNNNNSGKIVQLKSISRNYEGLDNNLKNPTWGSAMTNFKRLCSPNYQDGVSKTWKSHPNARVLSNSLGAITGPFQNSKAGINLLFVQFGQFLDHDLGVVVGGEPQIQNIQVPMCDKFLDIKCRGTQALLFTRSDFDKNIKQRTHINAVTHWIDGSQLYGNDKQIADSLRQFQKGKLELEEDNLLPRDPRGFYIAADDQINQNPSLIVFQTIFRRQHNRICDVILSKNSNLTDEQVYQAARNYVLGLYQHIVFDQFLPTLFGKDNFDRFVGPYRYDSNMNPSLFSQFSTASYRYGHSIVNAPFPLMDSNGKIVKQLKAGQIFFNPHLVNKNTFQQFLNGFVRSYGKQKTLQIVQDLRSFLFNMVGRSIKMDLFAFNVQRGRDLGICWLNDARQKVGLQKKQKFTDLIGDPKKAQIMQSFYHKTDKVDLWLGIIGEPPVQGAVLGELGIRLNALQFKNLRNADRLWYENIYPQQVINQIKSTSFTDIIQRNTGVRFLNRQAFKKQ